MMPKVEQVAASIEPIQKAAAQLSTVDLKGALEDLHGINESMSKVDWDELSRQVGQLDVDSMNRTLQGIDVEQLEKALENLNGIIDAFKKLPFFGN